MVGLPKSPKKGRHPDTNPLNFARVEMWGAQKRPPTNTKFTNTWKLSPFHVRYVRSDQVGIITITKKCVLKRWELFYLENYLWITVHPWNLTARPWKNDSWNTTSFPFGALLMNFQGQNCCLPRWNFPTELPLKPPLPTRFDQATCSEWKEAS